MKILAIADRPPQNSILNLVNEESIDLICTLGDLDYISLTELDHINHIPKIGVYGNHCSGNYFESLGIRNMHLAAFEYMGLTFGGFEGSVRYKESAFVKMYTQEEASSMLKDFPRVDVMLSHAPPYGINDEPQDIAHQGFHALGVYVETKKPKYLLHGHTYPEGSNLVTKHVETEIIYVYSDKIIELA